jgi:hypothetical protein
MTDEKIKAPVIVFYSWQSDSPRETNFDLIEESLTNAAGIISREDSVDLVIDRDTRGVGGSPCIVDTITKKIKKSDVFVWDSTIIYKTPKPAPNANVVLEYGYALAILGEGRMIAIMNEASGGTPKELPFDFKGTRRWPIRYKLAPDDKKYARKRARKIDQLSKILVIALRAALKEPKTGALQNDVDCYVARRFWSIIDSNWLLNWSDSRLNGIQWDKAEHRRIIDDYTHEARKAENGFLDEDLQKLHSVLVKAFEHNLMVGAYEMMPVDGNPEVFVIGAKYRYNKSGYFDDYDEQYEEEISKLQQSIEAVIAAWEPYITALRQKYPEITHG